MKRKGWSNASAASGMNSPSLMERLRVVAAIFNDPFDAAEFHADKKRVRLADVLSRLFVPRDRSLQPSYPKPAVSFGSPARRLLAATSQHR